MWLKRVRNPPIGGPVLDCRTATRRAIQAWNRLLMKQGKQGEWLKLWVESDSMPLAGHASLVHLDHTSKERCSSYARNTTGKLHPDIDRSQMGIPALELIKVPL